MKFENYFYKTRRLVMAFFFSFVSFLKINFNRSYSIQALRSNQNFFYTFKENKYYIFNLDNY